MNNKTNIAIIGLGQIGIYLYNELRIKNKEIEKKTGKNIKLVAISARDKKKKTLSGQVATSPEMNPKVDYKY